MTSATKTEEKRQNKKGQKCKTQKRKELDSVLITNLPTDIKSIYSSLIKRLFHSSPIPQQEISDMALISEASSAILSCTVPNKTAATMMKRRLHNSTICGRKWKVQCVPVSQITCHSTACLVECTTVPVCEKELVERALSAVPGFLSLIDQNEIFANKNKINNNNDNNNDNDDEKDPHYLNTYITSDREDVEVSTESLFNVEERSNKVNDINKSHKSNVLGHNDDIVANQGHLLASFVNEGSALHARAVLSGRLIGTSGAHLFLSRRR